MNTHFTPTLPAFRELAKLGNLVPVYTELIADAAWEELVERRESQSAVPNTIVRLEKDRELSAVGRGMLAALFSIRGKPRAAFDEQRTALYEVKADDPTRASRYAARLVRFGELQAPSVLLAAPVSEACVEQIIVRRVGEVPVQVEAVVRMWVNEKSQVTSANESEVLSFRTIQSSNCAAEKSIWKINAHDWQRTVALFHR